MSKPAYVRQRHVFVNEILSCLNADFLLSSRCYFGGGTRIVLELGEYRESAGIDFLCSERNGYRALRSTISETSLGEIAAAPIAFARDIRGDQYGIRTVLEAHGQRIKFEILNEARIDLSGEVIERMHIPCLDRLCCFAEKLLANHDRWRDDSASSRDAVDLGFMVNGWGIGDFVAGARRAREAYGDGIEESIRAAAQKLLADKMHFRKCVDALAVREPGVLISGLQSIVSSRWTCKPRTPGKQS